MTSLALKQRARGQGVVKKVSQWDFPALDRRQWLAVDAKVESQRLGSELLDAQGAAAVVLGTLVCGHACVLARLQVTQSSKQRARADIPKAQEHEHWDPALKWHPSFGLVAG